MRHADDEEGDQEGGAEEGGGVARAGMEGGWGRHFSGARGCGVGQRLESVEEGLSFNRGKLEAEGNWCYDSRRLIVGSGGSLGVWVLDVGGWRLEIGGWGSRRFGGGEVGRWGGD